MNRKSFLKKLGIGLGVAIVAPKVFGGDDEMIYPRLSDGVTIDTDLLPIKRSQWEELAHLDMSEPPYFRELRRKYPLRPSECYQDECRNIYLLNKKGEYVHDITVPDEFCVRFWDRITYGRHYIVIERKENYWVAIEM